MTGPLCLHLRMLRSLELFDFEGQSGSLAVTEGFTEQLSDFVSNMSTRE